jgi:DNA processing protein
VAVLGSGLDRIYPEENTPLAVAIVQSGAVVSEFPLGSAPDRKHFPRRNRLIAGWGRAVVVVEAAEKSGALLTAQAALEEGREVMAVPGHPGHRGSAGTNQLIRDGALLVRGARDVADELGVELPVHEEAAGEDELLEALARDVPRRLEELQVRCGRALPELLSHLTLLEVGAKVRRLPGPLFVRS